MSRLLVPVSSFDHIQGPEDAAITLVEYGDYECPYCGEAYPVIKEVQRMLGNRMRFVFRNFPISEIHPNALPAARFAEAAAIAGRFWEAHDLLYQNQQALETGDLLRYAAQLKVDHTLLQAAAEGNFDPRIERDFMGGVRSGVNGTPSLFINGRRYDGPRDVESLIDALGVVA
ncbi:DsbA family protein [Stenotrophomonas oahuensis]|uniref:Thioredoxin domain-containing protein n=1 Tax=Stenotrophomonas oahuensis TaxID=3003271 RepID=A0ABY9YPE5_9GAMM|nr:thioredoxin domain-containing protein [Stenotrophomonas sp. A5586]WNH52759.1 thioredoxin domain-containing protein [Stenotrophomonas sp. A5586]